MKLNKQLHHGHDDHDDSGYDHDDHDDSGYDHDDSKDDHDDSKDDHDDSGDGGSVDAKTTEGTATLAFKQHSCLDGLGGFLI